MDDLTAEEIAELRAYIDARKAAHEYPAAFAAPHPAEWTTKYARLYFNALPRLLDEVERSRALLASVFQLARNAELSGRHEKATEACYEIERRLLR